MSLLESLPFEFELDDCGSRWTRPVSDGVRYVFNARAVRRNSAISLKEQEFASFLGSAS